MTGVDIITRLEQSLDAARAALRHLSSDDDDAIAAACDAVDAAVHRIEEKTCRSPRSAICVCTPRH